MDELAGVFETVSRYFSILSEPVRVRIVHAICQQERTVNDIVEVTGATQSAVSRHLGLMYREGVVARRREGGFVYYTVSDAALAEICRTVCIHIASRDEAPALPAQGALRVARAFERPTPSPSSRLSATQEKASDPGPKRASPARKTVATPRSGRAKEKSRS